jgi:hypothetical protein
LWSCNPCFSWKHIERFKNKFWETSLEEVHKNWNEWNDKDRIEEYSFNSGFGAVMKARLSVHSILWFSLDSINIDTTVTRYIPLSLWQHYGGWNRVWFWFQFQNICKGTNVVSLLLKCKTNTIPILMHQMHILTT